MKLEVAAGTEPPELGGLVFASDPARAILATNTGLVYAVALGDGKQAARFETSLKAIKSISLSHDGRKLVVVDREGAMAIHDLSDGRQLRRWEAAEWKIQAACFGAFDEQLFAVPGLPADAAIGEGPRGKIVILDAATGNKLGWLTGHRGAVRSLRLSPEGSHVVTASTDGTARLWQADPRPGDATVLPGFGPARRAVFDPGCRRILVLNQYPTQGVARRLRRFAPPNWADMWLPLRFFDEPRREPVSNLFPGLRSPARVR